jgi:alcohol dehydrogenase
MEDDTPGLSDEVLFGADELSELPAMVESLGCERVLLVCGRRSFDASGAARILPALRARAQLVRFDEHTPNTDVEDLVTGLEHLRRFRPDLVLGIGGGSVMDLAKLLCAFEGDEDDLRQSIPARGEVTDRGPTLVLAPTTSGSGSEATHFAVVYVDGAKYSVAGPAMLPDRVVLDPELTRSGPPHVRATSGIDAVCQAIESLWAVGATEESRDHAREALRRCLASLPTFVSRPDPEPAREMCLGSHHAGKAINISKTTGPHALSYALTIRHGITHGHAVALTLGRFLIAHAVESARLQPTVDATQHQAVMRELISALGADDEHEAAERFRELMEAVGLPSSLGAAGVPHDDLPALADAVNVERLGNNPVAFDRAELLGLLEAAY